ncbi:MAG: pyridoxamine 5'-phosphate oxidase family protein [Candidatus Polarisedimenticolia bacterium]
MPDGTDRAAADPLAGMRAARETARRLGDPYADVTFLITAAGDGRPEGRALTLRDVTDRGPGVLINRTSPKWREIEATGRAGLLIYWAAVRRQYRVRGRVETMEPAEVSRLWELKSHGARLLENYYGEHHPQSHPVPSRGAILEGIERLRRRWPARDAVPRPESLAGIRIVPGEVEAWHGAGEDRLHDRRLYTRREAGWTMTTLVP